MLLAYFTLKEKESLIQSDINSAEETLYNSNIIKDVNYVSKDAKGNEYIIDATEGEIDLQNSNIIYLTDVRAFIKLTNSNNVTITSDFGKYNITNYDTIFSKDVIINYTDNKITGEYLDFSIGRNLLIISRNVIYTNRENILKTDTIEIDINTKDTKIYMYNSNDKVTLKVKTKMAIIKKFRIKSFKKIISIIEFENISLAYGNRLILDNISFKINEGQIFGMLGPNGVGKSTIFNLITGLINTVNGKIKITGEDVTQYPVYLRTKKFRVGYVPQHGGYFNDLTLHDNLKAISEIISDNKSYNERSN